MKRIVYTIKNSSWPLMLFDALAVNAAYGLVLLLRYDGLLHYIDVAYVHTYKWLMIPYAVISVTVFWLSRMYKSIWKFAGFDELIRALFGSTAASVIYSAMCTALINIAYPDYSRMPLTFYVFGYFVQLAAICGIRFIWRFVFSRKKSVRNSRSAYIDRILLIGAGEAGQITLRTLRMEKDPREKIVAVIDDDPAKWGKYVEGVKIVGGRDSILSAVEKYKIDKIYVAIPSATDEQKREILGVCSETDCKLKNLPSAYLSLTGKIDTSSFKDVSVEDLLGRDTIRPDLNEIFKFIKGKRILVTGGGGSIGSELCRQIASHEPETLVIFDVYENNAYNIQLELKKKYPQLSLHTLIGSVRDSRRLEQVFKTYKPDIVYHAAAHKHVPLMEDSPCEAIKNNVIGTYKTAYAAMMSGCKRFVLISTDKAVNPSNIMGASKRICEMVIQAFDRKIREGKANEIVRLFTHGETDRENTELPENVQTEFVAVRFGNVLGSNGSVVPIFKKQIEEGGPVTVTHPDIIRYFMTIPEAVSLVLLAGTYAAVGEIYVLDMGSPVKIDTLARNLIKLSGLKPDVDIKIEYTGLRQGEKLYEEKLMAEEGLKKTSNELIHIGCPIPFDVDIFQKQLVKLMTASYENDENIREIVKETVPTYHPAEN